MKINYFVLVFFRDADQVHDMMDDIADQQEVATGISDAISNPTAFQEDVDEDELERELEELEQAALDETLLDADSTTELPAIPAIKEPIAPRKSSNLLFLTI